jgi:ribosomal protein S18 acetylase RimI-like enzyme
MNSLSLENIKSLVNRTFPFIQYRWKIYATIKKIFPYIYSRRTEICSQNHLNEKLLSVSNPKLKIEIVNESDNEAFREFGKKKYNNEKFFNKLEKYYWKNKYRVFIATFQENIIGFVSCWANDNLNPPPELIFYNIRLKQNEIYMADLFIAPQYRGGGKALEFLKRVFLELKNEGYNKTMGIVNSNNISAKWTYKLLGYQDTKTYKVHIFFNSLIYNDSAIFIKNPFHKYNPSILRLLWNFRKKLT